MAGGPHRNTWQLLPSRVRCCASWSTKTRPSCKEQLAGRDRRLSGTDRCSAVREGGGDGAVETGDAVVEWGLAVKWMHRSIGVEGWRGCSSCCSSAMESDFTAGHKNHSMVKSVKSVNMIRQHQSGKQSIWFHVSWTQAYKLHTQHLPAS